ncbi:hypothetical protein LTS08_006278, partial [Lithohypha guttulata]
MAEDTSDVRSDNTGHPESRSVDVPLIPKYGPITGTEQQSSPLRTEEQVQNEGYYGSGLAADSMPPKYGPIGSSAELTNSGHGVGITFEQSYYPPDTRRQGSPMVVPSYRFVPLLAQDPVTNMEDNDRQNNDVELEEVEPTLTITQDNEHEALTHDRGEEDDHTQNDSDESRDESMTDVPQHLASTEAVDTEDDEPENIAFGPYPSPVDAEVSLNPNNSRDVNRRLITRRQPRIQSVEPSQPFSDSLVTSLLPARLGIQINTSRGFFGTYEPPQRIPRQTDLQPDEYHVTVGQAHGGVPVSHRNYTTRDGYRTSSFDPRGDPVRIVLQAATKSGKKYALKDSFGRVIDPQYVIFGTGFESREQRDAAADVAWKSWEAARQQAITEYRNRMCQWRCRERRRQLEIVENEWALNNRGIFRPDVTSEIVGRGRSWVEAQNKLDQSGDRGWQDNYTGREGIQNSDPDVANAETLGISDSRISSPLWSSTTGSSDSDSRDGDDLPTTSSQPTSNNIAEICDNTGTLLTPRHPAVRDAVSHDTQQALFAVAASQNTQHTSTALPTDRDGIPFDLVNTDRARISKAALNHLAGFVVNAPLDPSEDDIWKECEPTVAGLIARFEQLGFLFPPASLEEVLLSFVPSAPASTLTVTENQSTNQEESAQQQSTFNATLTAAAIPPPRVAHDQARNDFLLDSHHDPVAIQQASQSVITHDDYTVDWARDWRNSLEASDVDQWILGVLAELFTSSIDHQIAQELIDAVNLLPFEIRNNVPHELRTQYTQATLYRRSQRRRNFLGLLQAWTRDYQERNYVETQPRRRVNRQAGSNDLQQNVAAAADTTTTAALQHDTQHNHYRTSPHFKEPRSASSTYPAQTLDEWHATWFRTQRALFRRRQNARTLPKQAKEDPASKDPEHYARWLKLIAGNKSQISELKKLLSEWKPIIEDLEDKQQWRRVEDPVILARNAKKLATSMVPTSTFHFLAPATVESGRTDKSRESPLFCSPNSSCSPPLIPRGSPPPGVDNILPVPEVSNREFLGETSAIPSEETPTAAITSQPETSAIPSEETPTAAITSQPETSAILSEETPTAAITSQPETAVAAHEQELVT